MNEITKDELSRLKDAADAAEVESRKTKAAYVAALRAAHEFQPGDIIKSAKGDFARIVSLAVDWGLKIKPVAVAQKKDGSFGIREVSLWRPEWEAATLHQRAVPDA